MLFAHTRRKARSSVGGLVHLITVLLGTALVAKISLGRDGREECVSYQQLTCLLASDVRRGNCHPAPCNFDVRREMGGCVFPESGEFTYSRVGDEACGDDPFMTTRKGRLEPGCGEGRCCRGDHKGDFVVKGRAPGGKYDRYVFEPEDSECRYGEVVRGQILHYLRSRNSPIVVVGDSMMRQFFLRLVMMMRGQKRLMDYHQHAHAMYAVCREADMFRMSTNNSNETSVAPNDEHLLEKIGPFFGVRNGPGTLMARAAMAKCTRAPAQMHYMHLPTFEQQTKGLMEYLYKANAVMAKPVYLVSVGYWTHGSKPPEDYLATLEKIAETARKVIVVSPPTVRVVNEDHRRAYMSRNKIMKDWVATRASNKFAFLDYDRISLSAHPPPGGADNNWHYMCAIAWLRDLRVDHSKLGMNEFGEPISQIYQGKVERIMSTEDATCGDEMNRMLWQVVFNMLL